MHFRELSIEDVTGQCERWASAIERDGFQPDLVVFIAKAGYLPGKALSDHWRVPLCGVSATRKGGGLKDKVAGLFRHLPNWVRRLVIRLELRSGLHSRDRERNVGLLDPLPHRFLQQPANLLVVDDSVDTGHSLVAVLRFLDGLLPDGAQVRTASLNVWDKSRERVRVDYALYRNTMIKGPTSKDSREYPDFLRLYGSRGRA